MEGIIRAPTEDEKKDFTPIVNPAKRTKTVAEQFTEKLAEEMQKAVKKGLPFCDRAARDDFKDGYESQAQKSFKEFGYVRAEDIKPVKIDWAKYSDLKNFEVVDEGEVNDEHLTKRNPGLDVNFKKTTYKFKGYSNRYTVMESSTDAINRARQKLEDLKELSKKK